MVNDGLPIDDEYINDGGLLKGFDEKGQLFHLSVLAKMLLVLLF